MKTSKTYFAMPRTTFFGLLLERRLAIRMAKLLYRQRQEVKELLEANIDETALEDWTLAYPDPHGDAKPIAYIHPEMTTRDKITRMDMYAKDKLVHRLEDVYIATNINEAKKAYYEYHDKGEGVQQ